MKWIFVFLFCVNAFSNSKLDSTEIPKLMTSCLEFKSYESSELCKKLYDKLLPEKYRSKDDSGKIYTKLLSRESIRIQVSYSHFDISLNEFSKLIGVEFNPVEMTFDEFLWNISDYSNLLNSLTHKEFLIYPYKTFFSKKKAELVYKFWKEVPYVYPSEPWEPHADGKATICSKLDFECIHEGIIGDSGGVISNVRDVVKLKEKPSCNFKALFSQTRFMKFLGKSDQIYSFRMHYDECRSYKREAVQIEFTLDVTEAEVRDFALQNGIFLK